MNYKHKYILYIRYELVNPLFIDKAIEAKLSLVKKYQSHFIKKYKSNIELKNGEIDAIEFI